MKKKNLYLIITLLGLFLNPVHGSIDKSGIISGHEVWSDTIKEIGNITIDENGELTIQSGTYIEFQGSFSITVNKNGRILANGSLGDTILFMPKNKQTGWNGFLFSNLTTAADSSIFNYCNIQYCNHSSYFVDGSAFIIKKFNKLRISNSKILNCKNNNSNGAGLFGDTANVVIKNTYFGYNYAGRGGGVYFKNSNPTIEHSVFNHNICYWNGSGLYFYNSNPQIKNCFISNNYIGSTGGEALYFEESVGTVLNSKIINNSNVGIYCYHANIAIINTVIANNTGNSVGGIYLVNSHPDIINSTVVNNYGYTVGGIYCYFYSKPNIKNSIVWNNHGTYNEIGLGEYNPIISNCDIKNGNDLQLPAANYLNCINADPKFISPILPIGTSTDAFLADWSLKPCSPCINMGNNSTLPALVTTDISGFPRIYDTTVDIGAYESQLIDHTSSPRMTRYVKTGGTGDGSSWNDALGSLQKAIDTPIGCSQGIDIWLAAGTYYPDTLTTTDKRSASFVLKNNVKIFGGFKGEETSIEQRNWDLNVSILSGNIGKKNIFTDDSYNVVMANYVDSSACLDGLSISGGYATNSTSSGGGINCYYASPTIKNVIVRDNYAQDKGGAINLYYSHPYMYNVRFYNNKCNSDGGCGYFSYSNPVLYNCQIINNELTYNFSGGGLYLFYSNPIIVNTIIANNVSGPYGDGGGIYCQSSNPQIINSVVANNLTKDEGGGMYTSSDSRPLIYNSIFWNNQNTTGINHFSAFSGINISIKNSLIQGGNIYYIPSQDYQNNIDGNPRFIYPSNMVGSSNDALIANWNISPCSPAIDAGNKTLLANSYKLDLSGNNRIFNNSIDMGAYEFQGTKTGMLEKQIIYVKQGAAGDGSSWNNALGNLQRAISAPSGCYKTNEIWVANGTYKPDTTGLPDHRRATFRMQNNVKVFGGFTGNETSLNERNFEKNNTTLSGDIGTVGNTTDNCIHVVTFDKTDTTSALDGFYIEYGNANNSSSLEDGGGIYCKYSDLNLSNMIIRNNNAYYRGGGMFFYYSHVRINNVTMNDNKSGMNGAGMGFEKSTFSLTNSKICNNEGGSIGGIYILESRGKIFSCLISNNLGSDNGGIFSAYSNYSIVNSSLINNKAYFTNSGDLNIHNDTLLILNSLLWNNDNPLAKNKDIGRNLFLTIKNSDIQYGSSIEIPMANYIKNIDIDPYFNNPSKTVGISNDALNADWSLKRCSPCINKGLNDKNYMLTSTDLAGNPRLFNNDTIDLGPYEVQFKRANRPTDIILSNNKIYKNYPLNTSIGKFTAKDADSYKFIYSFSKSLDIWNGDSTYFKLTSDSLYSNYTFDFPRNPSYSIAVKVRDDQDCDFEKTFTISALNITGIENSFSNAGICVFPNPSNGLIYLKSNHSYTKQILIKLYDVNGKLVLETNLNLSDSMSLDLSHLNKGCYMIEIDTKPEKYKQLIILK